MDPSDPDRLILNKKQVLMLVDEIIGELGQNKRDNWEYIAESWVLRRILNRIPEKKFDWIWDRLLEKIDRVRFANTAAGDIALRQLTTMRSKDDATKKIINELDFSIEKVLARRS